MTEADWLASTDPDLMVEFLEGRASARKLRLYACACCRRIWDLLTNDRCRRAVEVMERYADTEASEEERRQAEYDSDNVYDTPCDAAAIAAHELTDADPRYATVAARYAAGATADVSGTQDSADHETAAQVVLLRDIFGNPFRPVTVNSQWCAWNDATILSLAQASYDERAFDHLPILADALEDAGCDNADILAHCRGPEPHVRGCWVIDLLLGKK